MYLYIWLCVIVCIKERDYILCLNFTDCHWFMKLCTLCVFVFVFICLNEDWRMCCFQSYKDYICKINKLKTIWSNLIWLVGWLMISSWFWWYVQSWVCYNTGHDTYIFQAFNKPQVDKRRGRKKRRRGREKEKEKRKTILN